LEAGLKTLLSALACCSAALAAAPDPTFGATLEAALGADTRAAATSPPAQAVAPTLSPTSPTPTPATPATSATSAASAASAVPATSAALDEVLVTGERPGPALWRVSKGGHDLWILATLEPLPKNMVWRSRAVEERIVSSQVVLAPPQVEPKVGFFRSLTLLPSLFRARKSPDGRTLEQVLPHDLYMRWLALRVKYLGNSSDENLRPMLAALDLYMHALDDSGLTDDESVWKEVEHTAHKHDVRILPVTLDMPIKDPKASIRELDEIPQDAEVGCLETAVTRLETDLQPMRRRANLWSTGDIDGLRAMTYPDQGIACFEVLFSVPKLGDQLKDVRLRLADLWLADAEDALAKYDSSFAVLSILDMFKPDGLLAKLRDRGYVVQEP
jgi:hypothetical protein